MQLKICLLMLFLSYCLGELPARIVKILVEFSEGSIMLD